MLRTLRSRAKRSNEPRILILGLDNAGKTTILKTLTEHPSPHPSSTHINSKATHIGDNSDAPLTAVPHKNGAPDGVHPSSVPHPLVKQPLCPEGPTQGFNVKKMTLHDRTLHLCDLGGQRSIREYWQDYFENTDCIMYVVDSSDSRRLEEAHETFNAVVAQVPRVPLVIFANKQDLATAIMPQKVAEMLCLTEMRDRKWQIQGCSAKTGKGLVEGLEWIIKSC